MPITSRYRHDFLIIDDYPEWYFLIGNKETIIQDVLAYIEVQRLRKLQSRYLSCLEKETIRHVGASGLVKPQNLIKESCHEAMGIWNVRGIADGVFCNSLPGKGL